MSTNQDFSKILDYNHKTYPNRKRIEDKLRFWFSRTEKSIMKNLLLVDENDVVHGQLLVSDMSYYYGGHKIEAEWLFDWIVDEEIRKTAMGVSLILVCKGKYPKSCSTGSGPQALPIHIKLGNKKIGEIKKYMSITPLYLLTSFLRGELPKDKFPRMIKLKGKIFKIADKQNFRSLNVPFNGELLEIARDKDYIDWRFFSGLHEYVVYQDDKDQYFVVRTIVKKCVTCLVLVDYRHDVNIKEEFDDIIKAVKQIARELGLSMVICGSSLSSIDIVLEQHKFKAVGNPRPIVGFVNCKGRESDIEKRNFCFVTLADSDGETNW